MSGYILAVLNPCSEVMFSAKNVGDPTPDNKFIGVSDVPLGSWGWLEVWKTQLSRGD